MMEDDDFFKDFTIPCWLNANLEDFPVNKCLKCHYQTIGVPKGHQTEIFDITTLRIREASRGVMAVKCGVLGSQLLQPQPEAPLLQFAFTHRIPGGKRDAIWCGPLCLKRGFLFAKWNPVHIARHAHKWISKGYMCFHHVAPTFGLMMGMGHCNRGLPLSN